MHPDYSSVCWWEGRKLLTRVMDDERFKSRVVQGADCALGCFDSPSRPSLHTIVLMNMDLKYSQKILIALILHRPRIKGPQRRPGAGHQ